MRIFKLIKKAVLLENSPIPRIHVYGLLLFAILAIVAAPFLPVDDDDNCEYELSVDDVYNNSVTVENPEDEELSRGLKDIYNIIFLCYNKQRA